MINKEMLIDWIYRPPSNTDLDFINEIMKLQQENEQLKKEKEELKEYLKYQLQNFDFYEDTKARMLCAMVLVMLDEDKMNELEGKDKE